MSTDSMDREVYRNKVIERILQTAREVVDGDLGVIAASRILVGLLQEADLEGESGVLEMFEGIDSQTDHLPVGGAAAYWDKEALRTKNLELAELEALFRTDAVAACRELIDRYSGRQ